MPRERRHLLGAILGSLLVVMLGVACDPAPSGPPSGQPLERGAGGSDPHRIGGLVLLARVLSDVACPAGSEADLCLRLVVENGGNEAGSGTCVVHVVDVPNDDYVPASPENPLGTSQTMRFEDLRPGEKASAVAEIRFFDPALEDDPTGRLWNPSQVCDPGPIA